MYYYTINYSFDGDRPVKGPFKSYESCWDNMNRDAEKEYRIDTEEAGFNTIIEKDTETGTIVLRNLFEDYEDDITTWAIIDVPYDMSSETTEAAIQVLTKNGVCVEKAGEVLKELTSTLFCITKMDSKNSDIA